MISKPTSVNATIRTATKYDLGRCVVIVFQTMGMNDARVALNNFETPSQLEKMFVAEVDGDVVGMCGFWHDSHLPPDVCGLYWFAVKPDFHGCGIGCALLSATESEAKKHFKVLFAEASTESVSFYLRRGFVESDLQIGERYPNTVLLSKNL